MLVTLIELARNFKANTAEIYTDLCRSTWCDEKQSVPPRYRVGAKPLQLWQLELRFAHTRYRAVVLTVFPEAARYRRAKVLVLTTGRVLESNSHVRSAALTSSSDRISSESLR